MSDRRAEPTDPARVADRDPATAAADRDIHGATRLALAAALSAGLAVASTWPLAARLGDGAIALGTEEVATVPLASAWALWWTADRARDGFAGLWDAPIFYPARDTFAMSEPMPLLGLAAAPVVWAGGDPVLALDLLLLVAVAGNGVALYWLARRLRLATGPALACAAAGALLPYVHHELGVATLVPIAGVVLAIGAGLALAERPGWRAGLLLGAALGATYLACGQYAVFAALSIGPAAVVTAGRERVLRAAGALALAAIALAALAAPVALAQHRAAEIDGFRRSAERAEDGSASAGTWTRVSGIALVPQPFLETVDPPGRRALFPGVIKLLLAGLALVWAWRRPAWRKPAVYLAVVALVAALWSVAPRLGPFGPYPLLRWLPGIDQIRSFWRAGVLTQIAVAALAALAIHAALEAGPAWLTGRRRAAACILLALLAAAELWPAPPRLAVAPGAEWDRFAERIRALPPGAPIAHLPVPRTSDVAALEPEARAMLLAARHGHPILNGYSSFFPHTYRELTAQLRAFPSPVAFAALERAGIAAVAVDLRRLRGHRLVPQLPGTWRIAHREPTLGLVLLERRGSGGPPARGLSPARPP